MSDRFTQDFDRAIPMVTKPITQISVDRRSKSFAVFRDFKCVWGFHPYEIEAAAVMVAKGWIEEHYPGTDFNTGVQVVYPNVTKIRMS